MASLLEGPDNLQVGKGIVSIKLDGEADFVNVGEVPELEYEPTIETLDYFSSQSGIRTKVQSVVLERGGTLRIVMSEMLARNLSIMLMGTLNAAAAGGPEIDIFTESARSGEVKFTATNDVGPKWDLHFYNVKFRPSGSFNPISEEWNQIEVTGEVLAAPTGHAQAGKIGLAKLTNLAIAATGTLTLTGNAVAAETVTIGTRTYTWVAAAGATADEVEIGADASASLDNLIAAINGAAGAGTIYGTGTVAHAQVSAATGAGDTMVATARTAGVAGNSIATTETMTNGSWGAATLTGGADA